MVARGVVGTEGGGGVARGRGRGFVQEVVARLGCGAVALGGSAAPPWICCFHSSMALRSAWLGTTAADLRLSLVTGLVRRPLWLSSKPNGVATPLPKAGMVSSTTPTA